MLEQGSAPRRTLESANYQANWAAGLSWRFDAYGKHKAGGLGAIVLGYLDSPRLVQRAERVDGQRRVRWCLCDILTL